VKVRRLGIPDEFVEHGHPSLLRAKYKLDTPGITQYVLSTFPELVQVTATGKH